MAFSFDINDPKTQRMLATVLVPVVAGYAFFHFMIQPKQDELRSVQANVTTLSNRVEQIKRTLEQPDRLRTERDRLAAQLQELESLIPTEEDVALLLDQFEAIEQDSKVYVVGFEAAETIEDPSVPYRSNNYRLTIESGFHQFSSFMASAMSLPRILSFSELRLQPNTMALEAGEMFEGLEDQPRHLTIECMLTTYVYTGYTQATEEGTAQ